MSTPGMQLMQLARVILEMEKAGMETRQRVMEMRKSYRLAVGKFKLSPQYRERIRWMMDSRRIQGFSYTEKWTDARLLEEMLRIGEPPDGNELDCPDGLGEDEPREQLRRVRFLEEQRRGVLRRHETVLKELKDIDRELLAMGVDPEGGE